VNELDTYEKLKYDVLTTSTGVVLYFDKDGKLHREGGPAIICPDGSQYWYDHGFLHRDDGPAYEINGKSIAWWRLGSQTMPD
jgi:hypothetical protein